ncbi:MAG: 4-(cytidine 5'-diphospho)-2-C-methyl-D-erythritol kinase [Chitinophagales bacterium]|nr:4-(cytidine 5'-diphospho)-2-C-methyl-D-erythritol kinase [Chitinophagales bacterium]
MIVFPHGKINLGLRILGRRPDGFHDIESVFYPVPWRDALEVVRSAVFSFRTFGLPVDGALESNLCVRAYNLLAGRYPLPPVTMCLLKNIPAGAGLGGGSSDAAFALRLLNEFLKLNASMQELKSMAAQLGSDCSFFMDDAPRLVTGRGEILQPVALNLSAYYIVIVKTQVSVNTAWAYAELSRHRSETDWRPATGETPLQQVVAAPVETWKTFLKNDFEEPVFGAYPQLAAIRQRLYDHGALYAAMSGSGSAVYGLFTTSPVISFDPSVKVFTGKL